MNGINGTVKDIVGKNGDRLRNHQYLGGNSWEFKKNADRRYKSALRT